MGTYGIKIAKPGYTADTADNKNLAFNSALPCLKIVQLGEVSAVSSSNVAFGDFVSFPIVVLVYLYDSGTLEYEPIEAEFDSTYIYLPGGEAAGSYYCYFVCYT